MDQEPPDAVVFNGVRYTRQPLSDVRWRREYYLSSHGWRYLHRDVWEHANGQPIPEGYHIHHLDHDPFNNDPSNLVAITPTEHAAHHEAQHSEEFRAARREWAALIRPLTKAWHASEEGRAWHAANARKAWENKAYRAARCHACGREWQTRNPRDVRFCSAACIEAGYRASHRYEVWVPCPICGQEFWQNKYRPKPLTCGRKCGAALRRDRPLAPVADR